jgi:hypothetical protein
MPAILYTTMYNNVSFLKMVGDPSFDARNKARLMLYSGCEEKNRALD